ncbi:MAG: hypothetical protein ACRYG5_15815, partial [Janthinobacterium lividum]
MTSPSTMPPRPCKPSTPSMICRLARFAQRPYETMHPSRAAAVPSRVDASAAALDETWQRYRNDALEQCTDWRCVERLAWVLQLVLTVSQTSNYSAMATSGGGELPAMTVGARAVLGPAPLARVLASVALLSPSPQIIETLGPLAREACASPGHVTPVVGYRLLAAFYASLPD